MPPLICKARNPVRWPLFCRANGHSHKKELLLRFIPREQSTFYRLYVIF